MARRSNKPAFEAIQAELADVDYKVRKEAIKKLMRYQRAQAVEPLIALLADARADVRSKAVQALGRLADARALVPLLGLLNDKSVSVRTHVVRVLGNFGDRSVVRTLQELLNDAKPRIRQAAALSLGHLRDLRSLPLLLAYLQRAEDDEFYALVRAIGDFDVPAVIEPLLAQSERTVWMPGIIAEALSRLGADSTPALTQILGDRDRTPAVRACVALAFGRKPRPQTTQPLILALGDEDAKVRHFAAWALGGQHDPVAIEPLIQLLADQDANVCNAAIGALSMLEATSAVDGLIGCLVSRSDHVVGAAARALDHLHAVSAVPALLDAFCRLDESYNYYIIHALCNLGSPAIASELLRRLPVIPLSRCYGAVTLLERFPDPCAVEPLLTLLAACSSTNRFGDYCQIRIVRLLGRLGDARAIEPLRKMDNPRTTDPLQVAISYALKALEKAQQRSA